eukprot:GHVP01062858.1.p1 GENE.GHVP01062858.1~~GHVP01062858.1.p1  ORF type:complete len:185 (+),score=9.45 GHVP01062858.1:469-1023(+)
MSYTVTVLPIGCVNGSEVFHSYLNDILNFIPHLYRQHITHYIDDILIHAPDRKTQPIIQHTVLHLQLSGLPINMYKFSLDPEAQKVLGYCWKLHQLHLPMKNILNLIDEFLSTDYAALLQICCLLGGTFLRTHKALNKDNIKERKIHALIVTYIKPFSLYVVASSCSEEGQMAHFLKQMALFKF